MKPIINWSVAPRKKNIAMINEGIDAFCRLYAIGSDDSLRLQGCVEGVFSYLVGNIRALASNDTIHTSLFWDTPDVTVRMVHSGPGGEWDECLRAGHKGEIRRTSFDSMGLFIARDLLHELHFESRYDLGQGQATRTYELIYRTEGHQTGDV